MGALLAAPVSDAQVDPGTDLFRDLAAMDSVVFDAGFNHCDLDALDAVVADDLEFYHDQHGIQDKPQFLEGFAQSICAAPDHKPIRILDPGSLEVFPLYQDGSLYGAIQSGEHAFYIREPGRDLYLTSTARFTTLWRFRDDGWVMSRTLSFDHRVPVSGD